MRLLLHQFCLTLLSELSESNKTNANEVSYKASYKALLTRKTRLKVISLKISIHSRTNKQLIIFLLYS